MTPDMEAVAAEVELFRQRLRRRLPILLMLGIAALVVYALVVAVRS
jgi:hypothetical protein